MPTPVIGPDENLGRHLRRLLKYPMLDASTEADLVRRWQQQRDRRASEQLVGSYQRLVIKIASQYRAYGLPFADLVSEGNVGLMQAVDRFDVDRGFRLATYAMWWIRAAITDYVVRSSSLVRMVTNEHRKRLFFNLKRLKAKHQPLEDATLGPEAITAIATELGVPEAEVIVMDQRLSHRDVSVNAGFGSDTEAEWQDFLISEGDDQETLVIKADEHDKRRALLNHALQQLDTRERHIIVERKLRDDPVKLSELSNHYGLSRERVRQIEARAIEKLRRFMEAAAGGRPTGGAAPA
ncbi:MAG: sigma-70 family RNA polymerase sigma factor [Rhodospirillales bacterium]|nr:MAG: sigma-70 family RNA polymerase sigma factor [Rhodospirillales bacterium]